MSGKSEKLVRRARREERLANAKKSEFDPGRRRFIGLALGGLATGVVVVATGAIGWSALNAISDKKTLENGKRFDPERYVPPADGVILEKRIVDPRAKTVIIIPDQHPGTPGQNIPKEIDHQSYDCQRNIYTIITDLIKEYGRVALVQENVPYGMTFENFRRVPVQEDFWGIPAKHAKIIDDKQRIEALRKFVSDYKDPVLIGVMLIATYKDEIVPIPSVSSEESERNMMFPSKLQKAGDLKRSEEKCDPDSGPLTFRNSYDLFREGDRSPSVVECFCRIYRGIVGIEAEFAQNRWVDAPRAEVIAAVNQEVSEFPVIISGIRHLYESLNVLRQTNTNYIVLAPRAIAEKAKRGLTEKPSVEPFKDPDFTAEAKRVCE